MTPYFDDAGCTLYVGDALTVLRELPDESVQCCVTSPPFYQLRDYGVDGQIGLESSPAEYVAALVDVFREVRRVLKRDGTCWIEIGDSYAGAGYSNHANTGGAQREDGGKQRHGKAFRPGNPDKNHGNSNRDGIGGVPGFKPKDLMMMPATVAIALRDDGWYLRAENVWSRPNPMPESVTDRTTRAHSMVYMLAKSDRYFYDADAVREPFRVDDWIGRRAYSVKGDGNQSRNDGGVPCRTGNALGANRRSVWTIPTAPFPGAHFATFPPALVRPCILAGTRPGDTVIDPFSGAGTTAMVAQQLGRRAIGIELNPTYADLSIERLRQPGMELAL